MPLRTHDDGGNPAKNHEDRAACVDITPDECKERGPRGDLWVGGGASKRFDENWEKIDWNA